MRYLAKFNTDLLIILILIFFAVPFRFVNLGYSDFVKDEHRTFYDDRVLVPAKEFFLSQRKGPMQIFVSYLPYLITHDFRNELTQRIPYALINISTIPLFYLLVLRFTSNRPAALFSTGYYVINGFVVAFGRIVQYQNLNLLFSFLSLWFFSNLLFYNEKDSVYKFLTLLTNSLIGTLFFILSLLSHWDAVFIVPPILYILFKLFKNPQMLQSQKIKIVFANLIFMFVVLTPLLIPYLGELIQNTGNQTYLFRRIGVMRTKDLTFVDLINLYNPFVFLYLMIGLVTAGFKYFSKLKIFYIWFGVSFIIFWLCFVKPGTHIYNFIIPALAIAGSFLGYFYSEMNKNWKYIIVSFYLLTLIFLSYQSWVVFVDHSIEYPFKQEKILFWTTPNYADYPTIPMFGFTHRRNWDEINDFVNGQNLERGENFGYSTNEDASISNFYMDVDYKTDNGYYYIGIKRPMSFRNDYKYRQIKNKTTVHKVIVEGETVAVIYRVRPQ